MEFRLGRRAAKLKALREQQEVLTEKMLLMARKRFDEQLLEVSTMVSAHFAHFLSSVVDKHALALAARQQDLADILQKACLLAAQIEKEAEVDEGQQLQRLGALISAFDKQSAQLDLALPTEFGLQLSIPDLSVTELVMKSLQLDFLGEAGPLLSIENGQLSARSAASSESAPSRKSSASGGAMGMGMGICVSGPPTPRSIPSTIGSGEVVRPRPVRMKGTNYRLTVEQEPKKWHDPLRPLCEHLTHPAVRWSGGWKRLNSTAPLFCYEMVLNTLEMSERKFIQLIRAKQSALWVKQDGHLLLEKN